jgi:hypothetical protein
MKPSNGWMQQQQQALGATTGNGCNNNKQTFHVQQ